LLSLFPPFAGSACAQGPAGTLDREARAAWARGAHDEAIRTAGKAIAAKPDGPDGYLLRAAMYEALDNFSEAAKDMTAALGADPDSAEIFNRRGAVYFKAGDMAQSIADFDKAIELDPGQKPHHWQRGIAYYYAGRYGDGRRQFELHKSVNPHDVENGVWHFLCVARIDGPEEARGVMIPISGDPRVPMSQVYEMFRGKLTPEQVFEAAKAGKPDEDALEERLFMANLYVGLYREAHGDFGAARKYVTSAARDYPRGHYMWHVARVHAERYEAGVQPAKAVR
jgi:lipoprotein NlpI